MSNRVEFSQENKVEKTNYNYPKLKLKNGDSARILVGLEAPVREYVHTLRAPQIINGVPQTFEDERRDGTKFTNYKQDFLSRPICLGDASILADKGSDPVHCPVCALAKESSEMAQAPQPRYAMHVVKYGTKPNSMDVRTPYSVEIVVWAFTATIFNKIADLANTWGDIRKHDLLLGPCTNEVFQKFDISVAPNAEWLSDANRKAITAEAFKENQIPDLSIACGARKEKRFMDMDVETIRERWAVINGKPADAIAKGTSDADLDQDLSSLLNTSAPAAAPAAAPVAAAPAAPVEDVWATTTTPAADDFLGDLPDFSPAATQAPAEAAPAPKAEEPKAAPASAPAANSFDDLLADLG
jgi:hypothetical protein